MKKFMLFGLLPIFIVFTFTQCSGGSSEGGGGGGGGLGSATTLAGTLVLPNGDPLSGATVFIAGSPVASLTKTATKAATVTCDEGEVTCEDPSETSCASCCTCADGSFSCDVSDCDSDSDTGSYFKGTVAGTFALDCGDDATCTVSLTVGTTDVGEIAVVTGAFDEMENVLAKLGFGDVYPEGSGEGTPGTLELGTEDFAIYKCGGGRDSEMATLDPDEATYKSCDDLFGSAEELALYDIIFINCGADEDTAEMMDVLVKANGGDLKAAHAAYHRSALKHVSTEVAGRLSDFVEAGGKIYVTDLAYDYVEQSFPEFMDYEGDGDDDPDTAEAGGTAQVGEGGIVSDATINNAGMEAWITGDDITTNTIDSAGSPGFSCDTTAGGNSGADNLNEDNTIRIGDFLGGWGVMEETYEGDEDDTFIWIEGPVDFGSEDDTVRPLTASRAIGEGCVLYSSYHTSHSCPTVGFWPQERVLQYLVFETLGSCTP